MSGLLHRFIGDRRGTSFEGIALSIAILAVALHHVVEHVGGSAKVVDVATGAKDLDLTPTASLPNLVTRSVLDPCTGRSR